MSSEPKPLTKKEKDEAEFDADFGDDVNELEKPHHHQSHAEKDQKVEEHAEAVAKDVAGKVALQEADKVASEVAEIVAKEEADHVLEK